VTQSQFKIGLSALIGEALAAGLDQERILICLREAASFEEEMKKARMRSPDCEAFQ
jgi:hypothetical protein